MCNMMRRRWLVADVVAGACESASGKPNASTHRRTHCAMVRMNIRDGKRTTFGRSVRCRPSCDRQASRPVAHQLADMCRGSVVGSQGRGACVLRRVMRDDRPPADLRQSKAWIAACEGIPVTPRSGIFMQPGSSGWLDDQAGTACARESAFDMDALPEVVEGHRLGAGWAFGAGLLLWPGRPAVPFACAPFAAASAPGYPGGVLRLPGLCSFSCPPPRCLWRRRRCAQACSQLSWNQRPTNWPP